MNCLTNEELQLLIDNELEQERMDELNLHLQQCAECATRYKEQNEFAQLVKYQINVNTKNVDSIPSFQFENDKTSIVRKKAIWLKVAAIIIPLFVFCNIYFNRQKPVQKQFKPTAEDIMKYESYNSGVDANTAYQQNMVITTIFYEEDGKEQTTRN